MQNIKINSSVPESFVKNDGTISLILKKANYNYTYIINKIIIKPGNPPV